MANLNADAREWLARAAETFGDGTSEATDALVWSVAISLADIADALKAGTVAPAAESLPPSKMQAGTDDLPDRVRDGEGDLWMRVPGSDVYVLADPRAGERLEDIRRLYGIKGEDDA